MGKQIVLNFENNRYTLEYTRKTVQTLEKQGFIATDLSSKPATALPTLFEGAFLANHKREKKETIERMFDSLGDKEKLFEKLVEMYYEPISTLFDDPDNDEGKVEWEASF